jgi:CHASE3 domain sensor protein
MGTQFLKVTGWNILFLLLFYSGSYWSNRSLIEKLADRIEELSYHNELTITLKDMLGSLQRAESNRRGFIITQNSQYIDGYNLALSNMDESLTKTKELMIAGGYNDKFVDSLRILAREKIHQMQNSMQISLDDMSSDSLQIRMTNEGREKMNSLRQLITLVLNQQDDARRAAFVDHRVIIRTIDQLSFWTAVIIIVWGGTVCARIFYFLRRRNQ